jgi:hypothetical protein
MIGDVSFYVGHKAIIAAETADVLRIIIVAGETIHLTVDRYREVVTFVACLQSTNAALHLVARENLGA